MLFQGVPYFRGCTAACHMRHAMPTASACSSRISGAFKLMEFSEIPPRQPPGPKTTDNVRSSDYKGGKGSGKGFKDAKIGLLEEYAKAKKTSYKVVSEKLGDDSYSVTYSFPTAAILADFQTWQYKQPSYSQKLDKFSQKPKGTTGRRLL